MASTSSTLSPSKGPSGRPTAGRKRAKSFGPDLGFEDDLHVVEDDDDSGNARASRGLKSSRAPGPSNGRPSETTENGDAGIGGGGMRNRFTNHLQRTNGTSRVNGTPLLDIPSSAKDPASASTSALYQHSPSPAAPLVVEKNVEAGLQPESVYEKAMPRWRFLMRRWLVKQLKMENQWHAQWQIRLRTPMLDAYFYWTALFGTHTFFMTGLPMAFWLGDSDHGRGLLYVTGLGIYTSSYLKDLLCSPRPYSPPVIRLSLSTHGQEYGFPSSHSTNSVSIALFLYTWLMEQQDLARVWQLLGTAMLAFYASSVTLGRLYCGMHSVVDCVAGVILGWACWYTWVVAEPFVAAFLKNDQTQSIAPIVIGIVTLFLVHKHPHPVDDCPCFEDAIAILSVMMGSMLCHWLEVHHISSLPQSPPKHLKPFGFQGVQAIPMTIILITLKLVLGIAVIFVWRLAAKRVLRTILPPTFRAVSSALAFELPTRKHYRAATDYNIVPPPKKLEAVPSVIKLTSRSERPSPVETPNVDYGQQDRPILERDRATTARRGHYDVDVLTKVVVYSGIGMIAISVCPWLFHGLNAVALWP